MEFTTQVPLVGRCSWLSTPQFRFYVKVRTETDLTDDKLDPKLGVRVTFVESFSLVRSDVCGCGSRVTPEPVKITAGSEGWVYLTEYQKDDVVDHIPFERVPGTSLIRYVEYGQSTMSGAPSDPSATTIASKRILKDWTIIVH